MEVCIDTFIASIEAPTTFAPLPMRKCRACPGHGVVDDRGFPLTGQSFFDTMRCYWCDGKGGVPGGCCLGGGANDTCEAPELLPGSTFAGEALP